MGKLKVSFTTVLFVFSFIVCVIVAVVFVDRGPRADYDSFYEQADDEAGKGDRDDSWGTRDNRAAAPNPAAPAPEPVRDESTFADLPLDSHLRNSAQPIQFTPTPAPTVNPMQGRSPEDIARSIMGQSGINPATAMPAVPAMAVPQGIVTPAVPNQPQINQTPVSRSAFLPVQSNAPGEMPGGGIVGAPGGAGLSGIPSLGSNTTNVNEGWSAVSSQSTPANMMGVRSAPANPQSGMMISQGATEQGANAPQGFAPSITSHSPAPVQGSPGQGAGSDGFLLSPPLPPPGAEKWDLPAAPTLRPPPVVDPDRPRSDADPDANDLPTPGSMDLEGSSGQALAISKPAETEEPEDEQPAYVAKVNKRTLTADQALKLAEVKFALNDEVLTEDKRDEEAKNAAEEWADIVAAAELASANAITVPAPDVEKYAAMRPDFDPAQWQTAMAEKGFAREEIRQHLLDMAMSEMLVEMEFNQDVDDDAVRKAYDAKPSQYAAPRKVRLLEIYKEKPNDDKRAEKVADSMRRLRRQAVSGTDFGLLARQASQSDTRSKGGDLGWIVPTEQKDEKRDKAIADLKQGEITEVVEEPDGYRIYKLAEIQEAKNDFDGGRELVVEDLKKPIRKESLANARKKLESGEPLVLDKIVTARATPEPKTTPNNETERDASPAGENNPGEPETADSNRKAIARQLLADSRARQRGEIPGQPPAVVSQGPGSIPQEPGASNQLLYAPGTQVQQMGGQPAPPYQAGGQTPAPPISSAMAAPERVSVDGNVSVNYSPGETMFLGNSNPARQVNPAPQPASDFQFINLAADTSAEPAAVTEFSAPAAAAAAYATPVRQTQAAVVTQNNGWNVAKSSNLTAEPAAPDAQGAGAAEAAAPLPPGFGGNGNAPQEEERKGGVIGNVKSFFGGFRR